MCVVRATRAAIQRRGKDPNNLVLLGIDTDEMHEIFESELEFDELAKSRAFWLRSPMRVSKVMKAQPDDPNQAQPGTSFSRSHLTRRCTCPPAHVTILAFARIAP